MEEDKKNNLREILVAKAEEAVEDVLGLVEMDFLKVGNRYGFEQIFPDSDSWERIPLGRQTFLEVVGSRLGVDLINISEEQIIRRYKEEGVKGHRSEGGGEVVVLRTNESQLTIHVLEYANPDLGTRYDFVRES